MRARANAYNAGHLASANWVAWRLVQQDLGDVERADDFRADKDLPPNFLKITKKDYVGSGYDRGHMCPSSHRTATAETNSLTFLMSNMQPQLHSLNAGPWKSLETYERKLAADGKVIFVVAGGLFSAGAKRIGPGIAVPDSNFRVTVILESGHGAGGVNDTTPVIGAIMPNSAAAKGHKWTEFRVPVDEIEQQKGYDFLAELDDSVEAVVQARL